MYIFSLILHIKRASIFLHGLNHQRDLSIFSHRSPRGGLLNKRIKEMLKVDSVPSAHGQPVLSTSFPAQNCSFLLMLFFSLIVSARVNVNRVVSDVVTQ